MTRRGASWAWWVAAALVACDDGGGGAGRAADGGPADVRIDGGPADMRIDGGPSDGGRGPDAVAIDAGDATSDAAPFDPGPLSTLDEALAAVDPFIGTGAQGAGYAALTPAAQVPNGLVKLGPDSTKRGSHPHFNHFSGYHYDDDGVRGFSHLHFIGTGVADYGNVRVLPVAEPGETPWTAWVPVDKASERAEPGRYAVRLTGPAVDVALTASERGGFHRYVFDGGGRRHLLFDAASAVADYQAEVDAAIEVLDGGRVEGRVTFAGAYTGRTRPFTLHFSATVEPAPAAVAVWDADGVHADATRAAGRRAGAVLTFDAAGPTPVRLRVGVSFVDLDGARRNREAELDGRTFDEVAAAARERWADKLRRVRVAGGEPAWRRALFTAQYNAYRMPTRADDVDGRYRGLDGEVHDGRGFAYYTDLSLWDTFRTLHPWLTLTDADRQRAFLRSLLAMAEDGGYVPRWPAAISYTNGMIGTSADIVFADCALKGVEGVDYEAAFTALRRTADGPTPPGAPCNGRGGIEDYLRLGWLPADEHDGSVSRTLEYAYDDAALGHLAAWLGHESEAAEYARRGGSWRNLFDPETGFMRARRADGTFVELGDPARGFGGHYVEGDEWHWAFYVPHDPEGFRDAFGGPEAMGAHLETFFARSALGRPEPVSTLLPDPYYWHGNEPTIHAAWLFAFTDRPERVDHWVHQIRTRLYHDGPDGLPGNDDGGTLSAWYLFAALGMYPLAGTDRYVLNAPLFPLAEIDLAGGVVLRVEAPGAGAPDRTVAGVTLNGEPVDGRVIRHADIAGGGTLRFRLRAAR